ncbi:C-X-C motif chemokine 10-like [Pseudophryne corroboree]|uniref:C-X-C motif chemokine 10-like n=1 Tax=Pseudophryne corroboree TaxID=495146 RepID=UPI003081DE4E
MSVMSLAVVCSLGLLVIINAEGGAQSEPNMHSMTCRCLKVTSKRVNPKYLKKIDIHPPRKSCPKIEVLVTMTNDNVICIDPEAKWFSDMMQRLLKKNKHIQKTTSELASAESK